MQDKIFDYEPLRIAILRQAVVDYKRALKRKDPAKIAELERFFLSEYGQFLSNYSGRYIIEKCKQNVNN